MSGLPSPLASPQEGGESRRGRGKRAILDRAARLDLRFPRATHSVCHHAQLPVRRRHAREDKSASPERCAAAGRAEPCCGANRATIGPFRGARRHAHRLGRGRRHGRRRGGALRRVPPRQGGALPRHPELRPLCQGPRLPGRLPERLGAHGRRASRRDGGLQQQIPELGGGGPGEVGAARLRLRALRFTRLRRLAGLHRPFLAARDQGPLRLHRMGRRPALVATARSASAASPTTPSTSGTWPRCSRRIWPPCASGRAPPTGTAT